MLTQTEKDGARQLLDMMSAADLTTLLATVTKNKLSIAVKRDVIVAIINYSETSVELLKRKKVRRDLLFQYLAGQGVVVSASLEKAGLIQAVLKHWGAAPAKLQELEDMECEEDIDFPQTYNTFSNEFHHYHHHHHHHIVSTEPINKTPPNDTTPDLLEMARVFARWFYQMLNAYHPLSQEAPSEPFGEQHFFSDCILKVMQCAPQNSVDAYHGATSVVQKLLSLVKDCSFLLNPNVEEGGLRGLCNAHGLRVLYVCGTVHRGTGDMVGLYQQQFGMARDPTMGNNWKIKFTNLLLSSEVSQNLPVFGSEDPFLALEV